jgi:hypothetical protein
MIDREQVAIQQLLINTTIARAPGIVRNIARNIGNLDAVPCVGVRSRDPWVGKPAFICAAGPSLDKNKHLLERAQGYGPVLVVNTALGAMPDGFRPDWLVAIESTDVGELVSSLLASRFPDQRVALPLSAYPDFFRQCKKTARLHWLPHGSDMESLLLSWLGVEPVHYAGSVTQAAVGMALALGADPIVTLGLDLSYDMSTGKTYADGATWSDVRVKQGEDDLLVFENQEARSQYMAKHGAGLMPGRQSYTTRPGWANDGTEVMVTFGMLEQLLWFEAQARSWPEKQFINATEGGVRIQGWDHRSLGDVLQTVEILSRHDNPAPPDLNPFRSVSRDRIEQALSKLELEAHAGKKLGRSAREAGGELHVVEALLTPFALLDGLVAGPYHQLHQQGKNARQVLIERHEIYVEAADVMLGLIAEARANLAPPSLESPTESTQVIESEPPSEASSLSPTQTPPEPTP